jgi:hypothetical protein
MEISTDSAATKLMLTLEFNRFPLTDKIPFIELTLPDQNFIATPILSRLLDATLAAAGELVSPTIFSGPLNHSFFVCNVRDVNAAAKTIWSLLGETSLAGGAKIFRFCNAEGILRCVYPTGGDAASLRELILKVLIADNLTDAALASLSGQVATGATIR